MLLGGIGNCLISVFNWLREETTSLRDRLLVGSCSCICSELSRRANTDYKASKLFNICFNLRFLIIMANVSSVKSFLHVYALNEFVIIMRLCMWWYLTRIVSRAEATEVISNYSWSKKNNPMKTVFITKKMLRTGVCMYKWSFSFKRKWTVGKNVKEKTLHVMY